MSINADIDLGDGYSLTWHGEVGGDGVRGSVHRATFDLGVPRAVPGLGNLRAGSIAALVLAARDVLGIATEAQS